MVEPRRLRSKNAGLELFYVVQLLECVSFFYQELKNSILAPVGCVVGQGVSHLNRNIAT